MLDLAATVAQEGIEKGWKMSRDDRIRWGELEAVAPARWNTGLLLLGAPLMFPAAQYDWDLGVPWVAPPFGLAWLWVGVELVIRRAPLSQEPAALTCRSAPARSSAPGSGS